MGFGATEFVGLHGRKTLRSQIPYVEEMTEPGWIGKQEVQSTFCGNTSVSADNSIQSQMSAFGVRNPSRRKKRMTGSCLVSVSTDCRPRSESSVCGWRGHGESWKRKTPGVWAMVRTIPLEEGVLLVYPFYTCIEYIEEFGLILHEYIKVCHVYVLLNHYLCLL